MAVSNVTRYPSGFKHGISISGAPVEAAYPGNVYWVDSGASSQGQGTCDAPYATIVAATAKCTASNGDIVFIKPGHTETITEAAGLALNKIGVTYVFFGEGSNRAKITFTTAVTADMDISANNITMIRPYFTAGIDALTGPIDVNAENFTIVNGVWEDGTAIDTTDCIVATSGAKGLRISGMRYTPGTEAGTQKQSFIQLNGVDNAILEDIDARGDFETGIIENVTDEVLNIRLKDIVLDNTNSTPKPCMVIDANATGMAQNVKCRVASGTTYVSNVGKINWGSGCEGFSTDGYAGEPIGTAVATGIEGKIDIIDAYHDVATADATTNTVMSDVIGNKTDAAINAVTTTKTLMAYLKGVVNEITVPAADATDNGFTNDVVGNKEDAAVNAAGTTKSAIAYLKGILAEIAVPAADNTDNAFINDVLGQKEDAAATGAATTTDTAMGYIKQLVTNSEVIAGDTPYLADAALPAAPTANSLAAYIASGGTALGQELPDSTSIVDIIGDFTGPHDGTASDDNIKASLDILHTGVGTVFSISKTIASSSITFGAAVDLTGVSSGGALYVEDIILKTDGSTGLANGTNLEIKSDNAAGLANIMVETFANLGAAKTVDLGNASVSGIKTVLETGKKFQIQSTVADGTGAGTVEVTFILRRLAAGATIAAAA